MQHWPFAQREPHMHQVELTYMCRGKYFGSQIQIVPFISVGTTCDIRDVLLSIVTEYVYCSWISKTPSVNVRQLLLNH